MTEKIEKRDSRALEPQLITDPLARAEAEARNVLRQYDAGIAIIQSALERHAFKLRPSLILALWRLHWIHPVADCNGGTSRIIVSAVYANTIEGFWSIFKHGVVGTFHKISGKYMPL